MDQQAYFPIEVHFYISAMFVGVPDEIHEERPSFLDFENNWLRTDRPTDGRTDRRTDGQTDGRTNRPSYRDARTHLKMKTRQMRFPQIQRRFRPILQITPAPLPGHDNKRLSKAKPTATPRETQPCQVCMIVLLV